MAQGPADGAEGRWFGVSEVFFESEAAGFELGAGIWACSKGAGSGGIEAGSN